MTHTPEELDTIEKQIDSLRDQAANVVERAITEKLKTLETRYSRHKFEHYHGMGTEFTTVSPSFCGVDHLGIAYRPTVFPPAVRHIIKGFYATLDELANMTTRLEDDFRRIAGHIGSNGFID